MTPGFFLQRLDERPSEIVQQFMPHLPYPLLQKAESLRLALLEVEGEIKTPEPEAQLDLFQMGDKNRKMLEFIVRNIQEVGRHPSYEQIRIHLGWKSLSSVQYALTQLIESGHIEKMGRTYRVVRDSSNRRITFNVGGA